MLGPIGRERRALHIAAVADGNDHLFTGDQVLVLNVRVTFDKDGAARTGEGGANVNQLLANDGDDLFAAGENVEIAANGLRQLAGFFEDLVPPKAGQARQGQRQDRPRLLVRQPHGVIGQEQRARVLDQRDQRRHVARGPVLRLQPLPRLGRVLGRADDRDHFIDVDDSNGETDQHVTAVAGLVQLELGAADDHLFAEGEEGVEKAAKAHLLGPPLIEGEHVHAEGRLQRRVAIELVQDDVGGGVALEVDDHAHAVPVALVPQVGDALDPLFADEFGDPLDHRGLVHLIRDLGNDDGLAVLGSRLDGGLAAHHDRTTPGHQREARARPADDLAARREVRPRHNLEQLLQRQVRRVDQSKARVHHFAQIMRRNVGGHADGDAACAIDQEVRNARRQNSRLQLRAVIVRLKGDRVLVEIGEQRFGRTGHPAFGVTHGRRRIAVDRAEVALPVDQRHAHGEVLGHPDQGVIDGHVAVRVILTDHVTDDPGGLAVLSAGGEAVLVHREQDAAVHGLEPIAGVRQCAGHDHAHRVIEVAALQLSLDGDGSDALLALGGRRVGGLRRKVVIAQGGFAAD